MTLARDQLAALATSAFGSEWQSALARERGVALRTVQRWAKDGIAKPETAVALRAFLMSRRIIDLPAPPDANPDERDDEAHAATSGLMSTIVEAGRAVGWHEAELLAAMLAVCIDRMVEGAGIPTTRETLKTVVDALARQADR